MAGVKGREEERSREGRGAAAHLVEVRARVSHEELVEGLVQHRQRARRLEVGGLAPAQRVGEVVGARLRDEVQQKGGDGGWEEREGNGRRRKAKEGEGSYSPAR